MLGFVDFSADAECDETDDEDANDVHDVRVGEVDVESGGLDYRIESQRI